MNMKSNRTSHHHGNLREALIDAGVALLAEGGPTALTLRQCAIRAGVSHAAPAHHFDGLAGLRDAIAARGYEIFTAEMLCHADAGRQTPRDRLKGICRGYFAFACTHPSLFDLMFGYDTREIVERGQQEQSSAAYRVLADTCAPFVPDGTDPAVIEAQVWSLIHGFTTLHLSGRFRSADPAHDDMLLQVMTVLDRIGREPT